MTSGDVPGEFGAFLDVHWMILNDATISEAPKKLIAEQRCNAEWALTQQMGVLVEQFDQIEDTYLRERKSDVIQVGERVLKRLMGRPGAVRAASAEEQTILVAHDLSPADVIQFKQHHFAAFLTDLGGVTSHTAIVARGLNVPAVVAAHNARQLIRDGEMLIVDGTHHVVIVNPDRAVLAEYRLRQEEFELGRQKLRRLRTKPAQTIDGTHVALNANIELPERPRAGARQRRRRHRPLPLRVPVPQPRRVAERGRAVRGLPARGRGHGRPSGHDPHVRPRCRQAQGRTRRPRARRAQSRRSACAPCASASRSRGSS